MEFSLGSGNYKYAPFVLFGFVPLSLLPFNVAAILFYFILSAIIVCSFVFCRKMVSDYVFQDKIQSPDLFLSVVFICTLNNIQRELHLGNINFILVAMLVVAVFLLIKQKDIYAGILLALVIIAKPFFVLMLLPVVLRRKYSALASFCISILLFLLAPALAVGMQKNSALHTEWVQTMFAHADAFPSNTTIDQLVRILFWNNAPGALQYLIMAVACLLFFAFSILNQKNEKKHADNKNREASNFIIEWFAFLALMPNLFRTDWQHFLMTFPLLMVLLRSVWKEKDYRLIAFFVVLAFFYGGNTEELIGDAFSTFLIDKGSIGIANIAMIVFSVWMYWVYRKREDVQLKEKKAI